MPAGTYQLIIDPTLNDFSVKVMSITLNPGDALDLDTVLLSLTGAAPFFIEEPYYMNNLAVVGFAYAETLYTQDHDHDTCRLFFVDSVEGMALTANIISFVPSMADTGNKTISVAVTDSKGFYDTLSWILKVKSPGSAAKSISGIIAQDEVWYRDTGYVITGNVLVSKGVALTIQAGTKITFLNSSRINVRGKVLALGTEADSISFQYGGMCFDPLTDSAKPYNSDGTYLDGSRFEYCRFDSINNSGTSLGVRNMGYYKNCYIGVLGVGSHFSNLYIERCTITKILGFAALQYVQIKNSYIDNFEMSDLDGSIDKNVTNCSIDTFVSYGCSPYVTFSFNIIKHWEAFSTGIPTFSDNYFVPIMDSAVVVVRRQSSDSLNLSKNYWGPALTAEMNSKGSNDNISGITDFYDDFTLAKVVYNDWKMEPIRGCGPDW